MHYWSTFLDVCPVQEMQRPATCYRLCEAKQRILPRAAAARNQYTALNERMFQLENRFKDVYET
jgi:hypothetical protein